MLKKYWVAFIYFLCACLMVVASFYDLQINMAIYNSQNFYAKFFDLFGELPFYALIPFCLCVIATYLKTSNKGWHLALSFVCVFFSFVMACVCFQRFFGVLIQFYIVFLLSIITISLLFYCLHKANEEVVFKLFRFSIFAIIYLIAILLCNQLVKSIWGRCRYYNMVDGEHFEMFTPWWFINGLGGGKSFYSGHVTSSMALLCLLPLATMFHMDKRKYFALNVLITAFVVMVAVSRLIYGAHFLSDVTMAVCVCLSIYLLLYKIIGKYLFETSKQINIFNLAPKKTLCLKKSNIEIKNKNLK